MTVQPDHGAGGPARASVTLITAFSLVLSEGSHSELAGDARAFVALVFPKTGSTARPQSPVAAAAR